MCSLANINLVSDDSDEDRKCCGRPPLMCYKKSLYHMFCIIVHFIFTLMPVVLSFSFTSHI